MKKQILVFSLFLLAQNLFCQINNKIDELINKDSFTFYAEKAIASGKKQDIKLTNSLNSVSRSVSLNQEFYLFIQDKDLSVDLPDYQNQIDQSKGFIYNFNFNSKDFKISKKKSKRGDWIIKINPLDIATTQSGIIKEIIINTNKIGKATTTIYLNKNSPDNTRVFEGYITNNKS
ncbi:MAG: hypothetical protein DI622_07185 [Chryseobacterium sp.]|uniref:DUF4251 domain-containing protein n=1 Tax=Chryseobacterium sp. TaxID=1871047 RepID=UPI000DB1C42F|nr:DUF4251 domain-containing protein [Chryseobacterium sp.]MPS63604.1 DUF4251 domain-containing protein [Chryseobacterium sp.]PZU21196.1 MAG: hypothetical protein DI622_07185 [Chryseobacterium sp.]